MKRLIVLLLVTSVACGAGLVACGEGGEPTDPTQPYLTVGIDTAVPDTMMRIEVFNVPLRPDGRLAPEYFVGIRIGFGGYTSVQPVTMFRFGHLCSLAWTVSLYRIDPSSVRPIRLDREEGIGC